MACELTTLLPENDLVLELRELLETQWDIICHVIENKHYGTHGLQDFMDYTNELRMQILRIKGEW